MTASARTTAGSGDQCHVRKLLHADVAPRSVTTTTVTATNSAASRYRGAVLSTDVANSASATAAISRLAAAAEVPRPTHKTSNGPATRNRNSRPQPVDSRI